MLTKGFGSQAIFISSLLVSALTRSEPISRGEPGNDASTHVLGASAAHAGAKPTGSPCHDAPDRAGPCFTFRGRLGAWNGTPTFRILGIGTQRVFGVASTEDYQPRMPAGLVEMTQDADTGFASRLVDADFEACPVTKERAGHMRMVCVQSVKDVRVQERAASGEWSVKPGNGQPDNLECYDAKYFEGRGDRRQVEAALAEQARSQGMPRGGLMLTDHGGPSGVPWNPAGDLFCLAFVPEPPQNLRRAYVRLGAKAIPWEIKVPPVEMPGGALYAFSLREKAWFFALRKMSIEDAKRVRQFDPLLVEQWRRTGTWNGSVPPDQLDALVIDLEAHPLHGPKRSVSRVVPMAFGE